MTIIRFALGATLSAALVSPVSAEVKNPDKIVCKSEMKQGTRVPKRTCMTAAEWDALSEKARQDASESFDRSNRPWNGIGETKLEEQRLGGPF